MLQILEKKISGFNSRFNLNLNLLLILCLVTQHNFLIKFAAVFIVGIINLPAYKEFRYKSIPLFYLLLSGLEILKFLLINESYSLPHFAQFAMGMIYWISSLLMCFLIWYSIKKYGGVENTLKIVVVLNFVLSVYQLIRICIIEKTINPYNTGHNHPYGISTGDLVNGLFHGIHLTNAFVSILLCFYFIYRKNFLFLALALTTLLLTGSNYATLIFGAGCLILFFSAGDKIRRWAIVACAVVTAVFYLLVTPLNAEYMLEKVAHVSATLPNSSRVLDEEEEQRKSGYINVTVADTNNPYAEEGLGTHKVFVGANGTDSAFNFVTQGGKARSYHQTKKFLMSSPAHFLFGAGVGGFSSKLAFNSSGVMEGSKLTKVLPKYETPYFSKNHKALYVYLKTQHIMFHSESNRPFSVYNQLLGEYGVVGMLLFVIFYLLFFIRRIRYRTYAVPALLAVLFLFNIDYLFEGLSVMLFLETLLFLDMDEKLNEQLS